MASAPRGGQQGPLRCLPAPCPRHQELFRIPFSPSGRQLTINILSTWGDAHYVGLNGLEIFDAEGVCISDPKTNPHLTIRGDPDRCGPAAGARLHVTPGPGGDSLLCGEDKHPH